MDSSSATGVNSRARMPMGPSLLHFAGFIHMLTLQSYEIVGQSGIKLNHYE